MQHHVEYAETIDIVEVKAKVYLEELVALKEHVFLWRCLLGVLPMGVVLDFWKFSLVTYETM